MVMLNLQTFAATRVPWHPLLVLCHGMPASPGFMPDALMVPRLPACAAIFALTSSLCLLACQAAFNTTQQLLAEGKLLAGHDISDGGLLTTVLEMAFAGNCGVDVDVAPASADPLPTHAALFAEELGLVIEASAAAVAPCSTCAAAAALLLLAQMQRGWHVRAHVSGIWASPSCSHLGLRTALTGQA